MTVSSLPVAAPPIIKVLLVDDQRMIGEVVRRLLQDQPHIQYYFCLEAEKAVGMANELQPDVILQDLVMPNIGGLDLVRHYRANAATARTPVVILSAADEGDIQRELTLAGADDFLVKLPTKADLLARIHTHAGRPHGAR